jgi:hypothetical protein
VATAEELRPEARRSADTVVPNRYCKLDVFCDLTSVDGAKAYDFHLECGDVATDRGVARGHTNSPHSTNLEFRGRYLSHIHWRDRVMASHSIRHFALKGDDGKHLPEQHYVTVPGHDILMLVTD